jgi:hypothetical protein
MTDVSAWQKMLPNRAERTKMLLADGDQARDITRIAAGLIARLERLPPTRTHTLARILVGSATFFDGFNSLAIAYVLPELIREWGLSQGSAGAVCSHRRSIAA